ncbi:MAG: glycosyltransferase family 4 protein [Rhodospirillaceae bacterium]|nr:glycosyltransferase family 4 protein [Rhodospirillaceae bacterium]
MTISRLGITWQLSDSHGWGVFGLNLALNLVRRGEPTPLLFTEPLLSETPPALQPFIDEQRQVQAQVLDPAGGSTVKVGGVVVLHALANSFRSRDNIRGGTDIGFIFYEHGGIDADVQARAAAYDRILAGSSWNRDYARAHGIDNIEFVSQGIDTAVFHPDPSSGAYRDRFAIFSGGKLEIRKGQDLVLAAFKIFHARHPDAVLVTSWRNAWPESAKGMSASVHIDHDPETRPDGEVDVRRWAAENGVAEDAFIDLGWVPNTQMAAILRDMDVALFPNRCEGGTNLVAMEAMACGVACILSANTGHLDIIAGDNCFELEDQRPISPNGSETEMWRESQVDEIVAQLESAYGDRDAANRRGDTGAAFMKDLSWANQTDRLLGAIADLI